MGHVCSLALGTLHPVGPPQSCSTLIILPWVNLSERASVSQGDLDRQTPYMNYHLLVEGHDYPMLQIPEQVSNLPKTKH